MNICPMCEDCPDNCKMENPSYKPTNADRIRAMSDEELAECFEKQISVCIYSFQMCNTTCWECLLEWLKEPVKDGET